MLSTLEYRTSIMIFNFIKAAYTGLGQKV